MYGLVGDTVKWYLTNGTHQYQGGELSLYDRAALEISKRQEFAAFLAGCIRKPEGKTLEIAAGSGLVSEVLQQRLEDITFLDYSAPALNMLRDRVSSAARVVNASYYDQPFADESFDTVICVGGYRYVEPGMEQRFWSENTRIVRAGGSIVCAQFKPRFVTMNGLELPHSVEGLEVAGAYQYTPHVGRGITFRTGEYDVIDYTVLPRAVSAEPSSLAAA